MIKYTIDKNQSITFEGRTLYRIKALRDFADVTKGDYGGYIQNYRNLSQDGTCWIYDDAKVLDKGSVSQSATVYHNAIVRDYVKIERTALIEDNAIISQHAIVTGLANICGNAQIKGNSLIMDSALINGDAIIDGDDVTIYGRTILSSNSHISKNSDYITINGLNGKAMTYCFANDYWCVDSFYIAEHFYGTTTELLLAIDNSSVNDKADYIPFITFAQSLKKEIS